MSLKVLDLNTGNEGIFSSVIDFFKGSSVHISQKDAEQKINDLFGNYKKDYKKIEAEVRAILDTTVFNQEWVSKAIPLKTSVHPYGQA